MTHHQQTPARSVESSRRSGVRWITSVAALSLLIISAPPYPAAPADGTFIDDDGNPHELAIEAIAEIGVTNGCGPGLYCPSDVVNRQQMASFLSRALGLSPESSGPFVDLTPNEHEGDINAIAAAGITLGCAPDHFCPLDPVSREQMASFITRAFDLDSAEGAGFVDVRTTNPHTSDIDSIAAAGITVGCAEDRYCPAALVLRDQMASFIARSIELVEPPAQSTGPGEGLVRLAVNAKSGFDHWTESPSATEQQQMRRLYDLMVVYSPYFDSRTSWFPDAIAYLNLHAIYTDTERDTRSETNPQWILRDENGRPLYIDWGCSAGSCPQYAGDPGHPAFRADFIKQVASLIDVGYSGIMIDDVNMVWRISDGNGDPVTPFDPRTGTLMTLTDWRRYVAEMVEAVRATFPNIEIMHNAIWFSDTPDFDDPHISRQIASADWIMLERGATDEGLVGGFTSKWSIHTLFDYVDSVHRTGTGVLYLDESADTLAEQEYNLAAYLLTSNGTDLVSTENYAHINPDTTWIGFTIDLGDALGDRYDYNGITRRDFTGGIVLLADPGAPTTNITLPTTLTTLDGKTINTITLAPKTASILLHD